MLSKLYSISLLGILICLSACEVGEGRGDYDEDGNPTNVDQVEGNWRLVEVKKTTPAGFIVMQTGYESGNFTFDHDNDAIYYEGYEMRGTWRRWQEGSGFRDNTGTWIDTSYHFSIDIRDVSRNRIINWVFNSVGVDASSHTMICATNRPGFKAVYRFQ